MALGCIYASKEMHLILLSYVLRWPMELFDTTPLGRVLNRFSKDVDVVDNVLPHVIRSWIMMFFSVNFRSNFLCSFVLKKNLIYFFFGILLMFYGFCMFF